MADHDEFNRWRRYVETETQEVASELHVLSLRLQALSQCPPHPPEDTEPAKEEAFGPALRALRMRAGISQREAAERAGVRRQMWNYYENGSMYPVLPNLLRALDAVGSDLEDLAAVMEQTS